MTLKVRDEEDVLDHNLRFHVAQGVDFFVVTDNGSRDATPEILDRYVRAGLAHVIEEPQDALKNRGRAWVTRMARMAATDFDADWVINADADEFWWPLGGGTVAEALAGIAPPYGVVNAPRPELVGRPDGPEPFLERLVFRETRSRATPKVAHRAADDLLVGNGGHRLAIVRDDKVAEQRTPRFDRAVLRAVAGTGQDEARWRLVPAPRWPLRILHLPLRSFNHYRRRVELTLFHGDYRDRRSNRGELLRAYENGGLPELYAQLVYDDRAVEEALAAGELVRDTSLRDFLAGCPDPLAEGGMQAARDWAAQAPRPSREERERDLAVQELDMMQALVGADGSVRRRAGLLKRRVRRVEGQRARQRERARELERQVRRLERGRRRQERRLAAMEATRWWRTREAIAAAAARVRRPRGR